MAYTSHGHHVKGTVLEDRPIGLLTARCGGPGMCKNCSREAATLTVDIREIDPYEPVPFQFQEIDAEALHAGRQTLIKVFEAFRRAGISEHQAATAMDEMMNAGLIFMERKN